MAKHPAKFSDVFIPIFADALKGYKKVYDPMAGTGKLGKIKSYGYEGEVYCNEIEPEWVDYSFGVDQWYVGDASSMPHIADSYFDAICTSPTYGNRMADHFEAKDESHRITYRHYLGRVLNKNNTGRMQWGKKYRKVHEDIYLECKRVLCDKGLFILNVSDHIRKGEIIKVSDWHKNTLIGMGFICFSDEKIKIPRMGFGANSALRVDHERVMMFYSGG